MPSAPDATRTLLFECRGGRAELIFNRGPQSELEPSWLRALTLSQAQARLGVVYLAPADALVSAPPLDLKLLPHLNAFGVRQWAPRFGPVEWPPCWVLRMHLAELAAGPLYVVAHFTATR